MAAKTGKTRLKAVGRLTTLASQAAELALKDNGTARDDEMVDNLLQALQLFKDNKLGSVAAKPFFDVSGAKLYRGKLEFSHSSEGEWPPNSGQYANLMLLVRFAPASGDSYYSEWQIDVGNDLSPFINFPEGSTPSRRGTFSTKFRGYAQNAPAWAFNFGCAKLPVGLMDYDLMEFATPLMKELAKEFIKIGREVVAIGEYDGSFGPSHFLRDGVIYQRPKEKKSIGN